MTAATSHPIDRIKHAVDRVLAALLVFLMGLLVVDVLWQVFTRFVLGNPSTFTDELARFLLIWVGLLGAAYAVGQQLHLAIDLVTDRLGRRSNHLVGMVIQAAVLAFAVAVLVVGGGRLVGLTLLLGQTSAALGVPLGYVYSVLPLSGLLMAFYSAVLFGAHLRAFRAKTESALEAGPEAVPEVAATTAGYE